MNFYRQAAEILDKLSLKKGTVKSLVLNPKVQDKKRMYAIVCETLKYKLVLEDVIEGVGLLKTEKKVNLSKSLALVLCHDLLLTKRGPPKSILMAPAASGVVKNKSRLAAELARLKVRRGVQEISDLLPASVKNAVTIPRYVRVNTLKTTPDHALRHYIRSGYRQVEEWSKTVMQDPHLPELLILPSGTDLHADALYVRGDIIIQDKASCFPAFVLNPPPGSSVVDACAAPGNKTSHLVARMNNQGKVIAYDLDARRLDLLKRMTGKAGCNIIQAKHGSFLETNPKDEALSQVEYLLLDPSCSGSGIISRLDHLADVATASQSSSEWEEKDRLVSLSQFQISIIKHAMTFPAARKIVYSTCSVHAQENERVVETILASHPHFILAPRSQVLPTWSTRGETKSQGNLTDEQLDSLVRAYPDKDRTNGFFVACFIRRPASISGYIDAGIKETRKHDRSESEGETDKEEEEEIREDAMESPAATSTIDSIPGHPKRRKQTKKKQRKRAREGKDVEASLW
ncbi:williams-Beuren syndrome critical region protein 20 copy A [Piptocephalis cylindrospora]|uniref:Williams-Beuren syndrome critical region protein 20 copy A n=1 Tax=Piptocephalis cylindrospora TaxID=1907219 RepID=A0A4P9Y4X7_9FUNG|nr:williams-Beuren syndrome critical region protein 20 copy A [Piptocephalis cylindrospora]|eukprot:RKP12880.1 williams-Beuren syndrome critical region protein 20 copy A [Piptocephalis cylindrospora]